MGTPLPPNEPGNLCTRCWGPGQTFGDTVTPKFVTVQLHDLQPGEFWVPANEQAILAPTLISQSGLACTWNGGPVEVLFVWSWRAIGTTIIVRDTVANADLFESFMAPNCLLEYPDDFTAPAGRAAFGGRITFDWNPEGL